MVKNYSKSAYNINEIKSINSYELLIFEKYYGNIINYLDKNKFILEFGPGSLKWFQYLYSKGFKKFILIEIDLSFYLIQKKFLINYPDIEIKHINENICNPNILKTIDIKNIGLISSFQVIEHIELNNFKTLIMNLDNIGYKNYYLFETINAQNIIQGNFAIYHDYTHKLSFTPRSLKMMFIEIGNFNFIKTIGIGYPNCFDLSYILKYKIKLNKLLLQNLFFITIYSFPYFLSKFLSKFFIGRYILKDDKVFDAGFALFFNKK